MLTLSPTQLVRSAPPASNMGTENNTQKEDRTSPEYLAQLLKDKKQIQALPGCFLHLDRLVDEEINRVRVALFHITTQKDSLVLPDAAGPVVSLSEKVFVPVKEYPDFNFVGRILGPRGMTAKQLEQDTGCKIMVRGKGSMRDKKKEEMNRGKPNWEHLSEELHVLITVEDTRNRGEMKLKRAAEEVKKLLVPAPEGEDDLKKMQLMELAIINGTYRDNKPFIPPWSVGTFIGQPGLAAPRMMAPMHMQPQLRSPTPAGAPIILAPRLPPMTTASLMNGAPPPLMTPAEAGLIYPGYEYNPYALAPALLEYPGTIEQSAVGTSYMR